MKIKLPKIERATKKKLIFSALAILGFLTMVCAIAVKVALWFDSNKVIVKSPIVITTQKVVTVEKRKSIVPFGFTDDFLFRDDVENIESVYDYIKNSANPEIAMLIAGVFYEEPKLWIAIFTAESGLNKDAINYNCIYQENGKPVSRSCNRGDEGNAWSVDCGVAQLNFSGKECPTEAFDPLWNVLSARRKSEIQGKEAWVVFNTGAYLAKY